MGHTELNITMTKIEIGLLDSGNLKDSVQVFVIKLRFYIMLPGFRMCQAEVKNKHSASASASPAMANQAGDKVDEI